MSRSRRIGLLVFGALVVGLILGSLGLGMGLFYFPTERLTSGYELRLAHKNYSRAIAATAEELDLPYPYFMALTVLECSGESPCGTRFENHVYNRLLAVRDGQKPHYERITSVHIHDATDPALRNLATSWGPFQLMGYKCIGMSVHVADLRGEESLRFGMEWIAEEYGQLLRQGRFEDAFHMHNRGTLYPKIGPPRTHDPNYVSRGLRYMEYFENRKP